jgi:hypothetical protein
MVAMGSMAERPQLTLDGAEDAALLAGDEDAAWMFCVLTAASLSTWAHPLDPVVLCFLDRIAPSDANRESCFALYDRQMRPPIYLADYPGEAIWRFKGAKAQGLAWSVFRNVSAMAPTGSLCGASDLR